MGYTNPWIGANIKTGLRAALIAMNDQYGAQWHTILPWILLGRRTSYHEELGTTPATVVFGDDPRLPGEALPVPTGETLPQLIEKVQETTNRPPAQTSLQKTPYVYMPHSAKTCTHVYIKRAKKRPLEPLYRGPFEILERLGDSTLRVKVLEFAGGAPREEIRHWNCCFPAPPQPDIQVDSRPALGRKPLNAKATPFQSRKREAVRRKRAQP